MCGVLVGVFVEVMMCVWGVRVMMCVWGVRVMMCVWGVSGCVYRSRHQILIFKSYDDAKNSSKNTSTHDIDRSLNIIKRYLTK